MASGTVTSITVEALSSQSTAVRAIPYITRVRVDDGLPGGAISKYEKGRCYST